MSGRWWRWVVVVLLAVGVCVVAIDAIRRCETLNTFTRGMGTPDNPTPVENRRAETNLWYLMGLAVGTASGAAVVSCMLLIRVQLRRSRYTLDELVAGITDQNRHPETDWGPDVGREVL